MLDILVQVSRYFFVLCGFYFFFAAVQLHKAEKERDDEGRLFYYNAQMFALLLSHLVGFLILFLMSEDKKPILIFYGQQVAFFFACWVFAGLVYRKSYLLVWNIILYMMHISFIMLARLDIEVAKRQFFMSMMGMAVAFLIPVIYRKINFLPYLKWVFLVLALALLFMVNDTVNGAKNWMTIGNFSFQPSEFVKILYLLWLAGLFKERLSRNGYLISGGITGILVLVLVYQRDLGGALIFSFLFLTLLYIKTCQPLILLAGMGAGSLAALVGYKLFSHVRVRVEAFMDPWKNIDSNGYQIAQSLFAIGAGGWFGTGLTKGLPTKIPVVTTDFIFSAICEEFGVVFALFLIGSVILMFISGMQVAYQSEEPFHMTVAAGIGILFAFQSLLIIGGVTKFLPSTGVTLPFISYGGTSLIASCILIGLLQGVQLKNSDNREVEADDNEADAQ